MLIFISIKVLSAPILFHSHDATTQDCELCEFVITTNEVNFLDGERIQFNPVVFFISKQHHVTLYTYIRVKEPLNKCIFGRPPPLA